MLYLAASNTQANESNYNINEDIHDPVCSIRRHSFEIGIRRYMESIETELRDFFRFQEGRSLSVGGASPSFELCIRKIDFYIFSRGICERNVAKINKHNAEADLGKHTYKMGVNQFCVLVCFSRKLRLEIENVFVFLFLLDRKRIQGTMAQWRENAEGCFCSNTTE